jgi:hypothetical protein
MHCIRLCWPCPGLRGLHLRASSGKEGLQLRHLSVGQPEKVVHDPVSFRSLKQAQPTKSMGPDPDDPAEEIIDGLEAGPASLRLVLGELRG